MPEKRTTTKEAEKKGARRPQSRGSEEPAAQYEEPDLLTLQRAVANPDMASPADILTLQRMVGNWAVQRLLTKCESKVRRKEAQREGRLRLSSVQKKRVRSSNTGFQRDGTHVFPKGNTSRVVIQRALFYPGPLHKASNQVKMGHYKSRRGASDESVEHPYRIWTVGASGGCVIVGIYVDQTHYGLAHVAALPHDFAQLPKARQRAEWHIREELVDKLLASLPEGGEMRLSADPPQAIGATLLWDKLTKAFPSATAIYKPDMVVGKWGMASDPDVYNLKNRDKQQQLLAGLEEYDPQTGGN